MAREPVRLNIYDMYWVNDYLSSVGVGVFHSGLEVYGVEYAYGGHPFAFTGVFENAPKDAEELGENFRYRESVDIGLTDFTEDDVQNLISSIGKDFRGDKYHLINKNCNHFTSHLAKVLCGSDIPQWINRLASISGSIPFLERMLPQEWLTPIALQQSLEERRRTESVDGNEVGARLASGQQQQQPVDAAQDAFDYHALPPDITALRLTPHPPQTATTTTTQPPPTTSSTASTTSTNSSQSSSQDVGPNGTPSTRHRLLNFPTNLMHILTNSAVESTEPPPMGTVPATDNASGQQQSIAQLMDQQERLLSQLEQKR